MKITEFKDPALLTSTRTRAKAENPFSELVTTMALGPEGAIVLVDSKPEDKDVQRAIRQFRAACKNAKLGAGAKVFGDHPVHGPCVVLWTREPKRMTPRARVSKS